MTISAIGSSCYAFPPLSSIAKGISAIKFLKSGSFKLNNVMIKVGRGDSLENVASKINAARHLTQVSAQIIKNGPSYQLVLISKKRNVDIVDPNSILLAFYTGNMQNCSMRIIRDTSCGARIDDVAIHYKSTPSISLFNPSWPISNYYGKIDDPSQVILAESKKPGANDTDNTIDQETLVIDAEANYENKQKLAEALTEKIREEITQLAGKQDLQDAKKARLNAAISKQFSIIDEYNKQLQRESIVTLKDIDDKQEELKKYKSQHYETSCKVIQSIAGLRLILTQHSQSDYIILGYIDNISRSLDKVVEGMALLDQKRVDVNNTLLTLGAIKSKMDSDQKMLSVLYRQNSITEEAAKELQNNENLLKETQKDHNSKLESLRALEEHYNKNNPLAKSINELSTYNNGIKRCKLVKIICAELINAHDKFKSTAKKEAEISNKINDTNTSLSILLHTKTTRDKTIEENNEKIKSLQQELAETL
jgi:hypothetical protein